MSEQRFSPENVTQDNLHIVVAVMAARLESVQATLNQHGKALEAMLETLTAVEKQTTKTNGRMNECEKVIGDLKANQCSAPGTCVTLAERVRSLEDSRLEADSKFKGASWAWQTAISIAAAVGAVVGWEWLKK